MVVIMFKKIAFILLGTLIWLSSQAREVSIEHNGVMLTAELEMTDEDWSRPVVVMLHGTMAHNKMEIMTQVQSLLTDNEVNSLNINLSLGISQRKGMYDCSKPHTHLHEDAIKEIGLWVQWLKQQGATHLVLLGHSRGGNQMAWYAAENPDEAIKQLILAAPMTFEEGDLVNVYKKRNKKDVKPILAKADALIAEGKGDSFLENTDHIYCKDTTVTAKSFVSYGRFQEQFNTVALLPEIKLPILFFIASNDQSVKDLESKIQPYLGAGNVEVQVIDGAGHMFRDLYGEDMVDQIVEFLDKG
jgi:pimeloyl-ACP methyl ester carboxylesterase